MKPMRLVYQSGHTDVWCDGKNHVISSGGWVGINKPSGVPYRVEQCNCEQYGNAPDKDITREGSNA